MKSPFPGMDPYLERHWGDVHQRWQPTSAIRFNAACPRTCVARMQERIYIELPHLKRSIDYPDVMVVERPGHWPNGGTATAVTEPATAAEGPDGDLVCERAAWSISTSSR